MMKLKWITLALAVCMVFALVACTQSEPAESIALPAAPAEEAPAAPAEETAAEATAAPVEEAASDLSDKTLQIYCGAGMQKPFQEIADAFQTATGCTMNVTFANAAQIQTQIKESQEGDYFIAGSADEVKPVSDFVVKSVDLVKHIPVLAVAAGNPKGITGIKDLAKEDVATVIGDPESTPIGKIAKKAFSDFGVAEQVKLVATTTTAPQLATVISLGEADAAIIWKENCKADGVEVCQTTDMDKYVKTVPAAQLNFADNKDATDAFDAFLASDAATAIWTAYGYELAK